MISDLCNRELSLDCEEEAEALSIPKASPLLRVQRVVVDGKGRAVEYSNSALQDSFFRF